MPHLDPQGLMPTLSSCRLLQHYSAHLSSVNSIAIHPSGDYLMSGSSDMTTKIWDLREGHLCYTLHGHKAAVNSVAYSPDGDYFATGSTDTFLLVWKTNFDVCPTPLSEGRNPNEAPEEAYIPQQQPPAAIPPAARPSAPTPAPPAAAMPVGVLAGSGGRVTASLSTSSLGGSGGRGAPELGGSGGSGAQQQPQQRQHQHQHQQPAGRVPHREIVGREFEGGGEEDFDEFEEEEGGGGGEGWAEYQSNMMEAIMRHQATMARQQNDMMDQIRTLVAQVRCLETQSSTAPFVHQMRTH